MNTFPAIETRKNIPAVFRFMLPYVVAMIQSYPKVPSLRCHIMQNRMHGQENVLARARRLSYKMLCVNSKSPKG